MPRGFCIITPVISLTLTRIMFMSEDGMIVSDALSRVDGVLNAAFMPESEKKNIRRIPPLLFLMYISPMTAKKK